MSDPTSLPAASFDAGSTIRPLSVRMTDNTRAQLEVLAQVNNRSVTEETRLALEHWVEKSREDPLVQKRADTVRAEIEQEASVRRTAIESIFGATTKAPSTQQKPAVARASSSGPGKTGE